MNYGVNAWELGVEKLAGSMEKEAVLAGLKAGLKRVGRVGRARPASPSLTTRDWSKAIAAHPSRAGTPRPNLSRTVNVPSPPMRPTLMQQVGR